MVSRVPASYFEDMYRSDPDPWGFASEWYEARKYALTLAALPRARYHRAFEPGCSIGVLSEQLAGRADELIAADASPSPLESARRRLGRTPGVSVRLMSVPEEWPPGRFDLIVLSEMAYYFTGPELGTLLAKSMATLEPGGDLIAVHWRLETDYPLTGDRVHRVLRTTPGLTPISHHEEREFVLDVVRRDP